jgi:DNA (cytosine-5)-methyltransferase 1
MEQAGMNAGDVDLLVGGPPCQPFSKAAYWAHGDTQRTGDERADTLEAYLAYVEEMLPRALLLESVRGLAYRGKDEGVRALQAGLQRINEARNVAYQPAVIHINAAEHGVPQKRERTFVIAHREGLLLDPPEPTHYATARDELDHPANRRPYTTAWDALGDLPAPDDDTELAPTGKWADLLPTIPEGQNYLWHTSRRGGEPLFGWRTRYWSFLLKLAKNHPSWTIPASPGPATGPFHWDNRRLSLKELARLQTFPDSYVVTGTYREGHKQLGNAVPSALGELLGIHIRHQLFGEIDALRPLSLIPTQRGDLPPAEPVTEVPDKYLERRGAHNDHPGTGLGPAAQRRGEIV